ncbi:hypothetical protein K503DRAFT_775259, partial [Rhizopogon vinicolor AM-OR11-026]
MAVFVRDFLPAFVHGVYHPVLRLESYRALWRIRDNERLYSSDLIFRVHPGRHSPSHQLISCVFAPRPHCHA